MVVPVQAMACAIWAAIRAASSLRQRHDVRTSKSESRGLDRVSAQFTVISAYTWTADLQAALRLCPPGADRHPPAASSTSERGSGQQERGPGLRVSGTLFLDTYEHCGCLIISIEKRLHRSP